MTDLTNTAPKRIYLDIGDQFALESVTAGSQRWDLLEGVTWSEDNATSHGIPYVRADLVPGLAASGAAPADVRESFEAWVLTRDGKPALSRDEDGNYQWLDTRQAWWAWQAALASREASPAALTDEQIVKAVSPHLFFNDSLDVDNSTDDVLKAARALLAIASPQVAPVPVPDGFALVPIRMTTAMEYVTEQGDWEWSDLLAAAESITVEQYDEIHRSGEATAPTSNAIPWHSRKQLESLLRRSLVQLSQWQRKYGEHSPEWLPPAGDVRLAEDIDAALAAPVQVAPQPIGYAVERSAFRVSPHGQDAESREWLEFTDDPNEKGAFAVYAAPMQPGAAADDARDAAEVEPEKQMKNEGARGALPALPRPRPIPGFYEIDERQALRYTGQDLIDYALEAIASEKASVDAGRASVLGTTAGKSDLPKKLMEIARRDGLTWADRVAIGRAIAALSTPAAKPAEPTLPTQGDAK